MTSNCHRFGCSKRFEWTGSKTQEQAEREVINHLNNECTGHEPTAKTMVRANAV